MSKRPTLPRNLRCELSMASVCVLSVVDELQDAIRQRQPLDLHKMQGIASLLHMTVRDLDQERLKYDPGYATAMAAREQRRHGELVS